jgi:hypothetical protein
MADALIPIGSITPGVGRCWLVNINHEDGPVGEAWAEAYTSLRRAKADLFEAYGANVRVSAIAGSAGWLVLVVDDA